MVKTREKGLKPKTADGKSGLVFVKENVSGSSFILDREDNSVMRTEKQFSALWLDSGYTIVKQFF